MIGKEIPYKDYEGLDHKKTFYFSLNQTEFTMMNNSIPGGLEAYVKRIIEDHNEEKIIDLLLMFIVEGYGIRESSDDFIKEDAMGRKLGMRFKCSEACDNLIEDLLSKENNIWAFIIGMLPAKVQEKVKSGFDAAMNESDNVVALPTTNTPNS